MPPSRRSLLGLLAGCLASLAGCAFQQQSASETATETPTATPTPTPTATVVNPDGAEPPDIETPAPGNCTATPVLKPDNVPPEYQDALSIASYPGKPALTKAAVEEFCARYEVAYWTNWVIERGQNDPDVDVDPEIANNGLTTRAVRDGFIVIVDTVITYKQRVTSNSTDATPTPLTSPTQFEQTGFYVTDRFLLRQAPAFEEGLPIITGGDVVECW